jgi:hypothetical protein
MRRVFMRTPNLRSGAVTAALILAAALSTACATAVDTSIVAKPGETFSLSVGGTATVEGSSTKLTFTSVKEDSRCPTDVQCIWAGDAKIELTVSKEGAEDVKILSVTPPNNETSVGDLRIRFTGLAPVPRQADRDKPREYVAQLVVTRS